MRKTGSPPTDRSFGFTLSALLGMFTVAPVIFGGSLRVSLLPFALVLFVLAALRPSCLSILNRAWFKLGNAMASVIQPIVLGLIYFAFITPFALLFRLSGNDPLRLRTSTPPGGSWWVRSSNPSAATTDFRKTF